MSNSIKYSTGSESLALKKGNWWIGTGDVPKGPTSTTGYYNGITPPSGGYTIYLNKASQGPSIYTCANDTELIGLTNSISGSSYTTANECFNYYQGQDDKMILNRDPEAIVTDGLVLNLDAGFLPSYPRNGTTWYDLSGNNNHATLKSSSQFNSNGYMSYAGGGQDVETTVATVEANTSSSGGNTIQQWIWQDARGGSGNMPFTWYNVSWDLWAFNNYFGINNGSSLVYGITGADSVLIGKWNLVTVYFPNNWSSSYLDSKMWINGVSQTMAIQNGSLASRSISSSQTVGIGGGYTNGGDTFNWDGRIATTQIYNRELSSDEVLRNFNAQKSRFGL